MKNFVFSYPGDPTVEAVEMNREEFLKAHPREPILIFSASKVVEIPVGLDEICCDSCNTDPGDYILLVDESRAYCRECAKRILRYCTETE